MNACWRNCAARPGVEAVALDSSAPLCRHLAALPVLGAGTTARSRPNADEAVFDSASADLLATLKVPLRRGRFLEER